MNKPTRQHERKSMELNTELMPLSRAEDQFTAQINASSKRVLLETDDLNLPEKKINAAYESNDRNPRPSKLYRRGIFETEKSTERETIHERDSSKLKSGFMFIPLSPIKTESENIKPTPTVRFSSSIVEHSSSRPSITNQDLSSSESFGLQPIQNQIQCHAQERTAQLPNDDCSSRAYDVANGLEMIGEECGMSVHQIQALPKSAIRCMMRLLTDRKNQMEALSTLSERLSSLRNDLEHLKRTKEGLQSQIEEEKEARIGSERRYDALQETRRIEKGYWAEEKKELNARCMKLQHKDSVHAATIFKKERDLSKLQVTIGQKVFRENSKGPLRTIDMAHKLDSSNKFLPEKKPLNDAEMSAAIARGKEAEEENTKLRELVGALSEDFAELRNYQAKHAEIELAREQAITANAAIEHYSTTNMIQGMPAEWLEAHLGNKMGTAVVQMQEQVRKFLEKASVASQAEKANAVPLKIHEKVRKELQEAHSLLVKMDELLRTAVMTNIPDSSVSIRPQDMSGVWDTPYKFSGNKSELDMDVSLPSASPGTVKLLKGMGIKVDFTNDE